MDDRAWEHPGLDPGDRRTLRQLADHAPDAMSALEHLLSRRPHSERLAWTRAFVLLVGRSRAPETARAAYRRLADLVDDATFHRHAVDPRSDLQLTGEELELELRRLLDYPAGT